MQHGQELGGLVESILSQFGYIKKTVKDSHICCGSAGAYSIFETKISNQLRDNKIENLRAATHSENLKNQKLKSSNTSGQKNVGWAKREQRWRVRLTVDGKDKHIGYFKDRELADLVAMEACNLHHKEFSSYKGVLHGQ